MSNEIYWVNKTGEDLARDLQGRLEKLAAARFTGLHADRVMATQRGYYGAGKNGAVSHMVSRGGVQSELSLVYTNYIRYLIQHAISRISARRFSFEVPIQEATYSSREQAQIDTDTLEHFRKTTNLNKRYREALEKGYVTGEGYIHVYWDYSGGDVHTIDENGQPVRTGDLCMDVGSFWNVIPFDEYGPPAYAKAYLRSVNKHVLAAKYPAKSKEILNSCGPDAFTGYLSKQKLFGNRQHNFYNEEDLVTLICFYHERDAAVPAGKECILLGDGTHLYDGPLSYSKIPIIRFSPADLPDSDAGYSPAFDALGPIDAMNSLKSIAMSNQSTFGVQNIWIRDANNLGPADIRGGLRFITSLEKPEALQLTQTPAEIFQAIESYRQEAVQIMGLNDVALGIETTRLSGDAMDVLDDSVYQYSESPRASATEFLEHLGELILTTVNINLTAPIDIITNRGRKVAKQTVTGDDLSPRPIIRVELVDSALSSPKGKRKFALDMANAGVVANKEEFIDAYVKGQTQTITDRSTKQMDTIYEENELMKRGIKAPVDIFGDNPILHIAHNALVLSDPLTRANPIIAQIAQDHLIEHAEQYRFLQAQYPEILQGMGVDPGIIAQQTAAQMRANPDPAQEEFQENDPAGAEAQAAPPSQ